MMKKSTAEIVIKEIDTSLSSFELFSLFRDRKHCFFLDSGMDPKKLGRYSFIGFDPERTLTATADVDTFAELKALLEEYQPVICWRSPVTAASSELRTKVTAVLRRASASPELWHYLIGPNVETPLLKPVHRHDIHQGIREKNFVRSEKFIQTIRSFSDGNPKCCASLNYPRSCSPFQDTAVQ